MSAIAVLALLGCLLLAFGDPESVSDALPESVVLVVPGTLFGQTSLVAAWCALGPFSLARRLALSSVWLASLVVAFGFNRAMNPAGRDLDSVLTFGAVVLGQWALIAMPMWLVATWYGLQLTGPGDDSVSSRRFSRQIGIREVMVVNLAVAVVLGAAGFRSGGLEGVSIDRELAPVFGYLTVSSAILALSMTVAIVRCKTMFHLAIAVPLVLFLATVLQFILARSIVSSLNWTFTPVVMGLQFVSLLNAVQAFWIVAVIALLRRGGFRLTYFRANQAASTFCSH